MVKRSNREIEPITLSLGELKVATVVMDDIKKGTYSVSRSRFGRFLDRIQAEHIRRENEKVLIPIAAEKERLPSFNVDLEISTNAQDFMRSACEVALKHYGRNTNPEAQESLNVLKGLTSALAER